MQSVRLHTSAMMMIFNIVLFLVLLAHRIPATFHRCYIDGPCPAGTYYHKNDSTLEIQCLKCPEGFFIEQQNHTCTECIPCSRLTDELKFYHFKKIEANCNSTSDTKFSCRDGYCEAKFDSNMCIKNTSPDCRVTQSSTNGPISTTSYPTQMPLINVTSSPGSKPNGSTASPRESNATDAVHAGSENVVAVVAYIISAAVAVVVFQWC